MKNWLKKLLGVDELERQNRNLREELDVMHTFMRQKFERLEKHERIDADLSIKRGECTIVLTGVFRGRGYVEFYDIPLKEFEALVQHYRNMRKHHLIRNIDRPPNFYGAFDIT